MATNTDIKRVLKRYQSSAEKGLHGPSSYMSTESSDVCRKVYTSSIDSGCISSTNDKTNKVHFKKLWASSQNPQQNLCCAGSEQQTLPSTCHPDDHRLTSRKGFIYSTSYRPSSVGGKAHQIYHHQKDEWDLKYYHNQLPGDPGEPQAKCHCLSVVDGSGKVYHHHLSEHDGIGLEKKAFRSSSAVEASDKPGSYPSSKCCGGDDSFTDKWDLEKHSTSVSHQHHGGDGGDVVMLTRHHGHPGNMSPRSASNSYGGWADVGAFTPPSPYSPPNSMSFSSPPQMPFPLVMGPADEYGGKGEALLEGEMVACFSVGGERRLCFPQVLNTSLKDFSLNQINAQNQALHIYLSYCSSRQLQCLKEDDGLPPTVKSCGLITFSDAHRLTHALLHFNAPQVDPPKTITLPYNSSTRQFVANSATTPLQLSVNSHSTNHHIPNIIVSHRSFGKCRGWVYLSLYHHPEAKCIQCCECRAFYTPTQFVCHAHRSLENRTCHWGFDPANWRIYLQLASDQPLQPVGSSLPTTATLPEVYLEQFKIKFDSASLANRQRQAPEANQHNHLQQQQHCTVSPGPNVLSSSRPASRTNPPSTSFSTSVINPPSTSFSTSVITLDATPRPASSPRDDPVSSHGGEAATGGCPLAVPSKGGNAFVPPPAALVRENMPAPLPPNLQSKGPPVLADPGHVVPLSQYDKFRNWQPNVTLAPPLQKYKDSEKAVLTGTPATTVSSVVCGKLSTSGRKDLRDRGGETESYTLDSSKNEREKVVLRTVGGQTKGYTISLCQSYKPQAGLRQLHHTSSNSRECSTSEAKCYTSSSISDSSGHKNIPDRRGCPNITDQRGCPILSSELKLLSVDKSVVPKDLQIIKLDPTGARSERNGVPNSRPSGDESRCSFSKTLRILKVEPSSESEAKPRQEVSNENGHSSCRNSVARAPPERCLSSSSEPGPTIKQERLYADEGTGPSGDSQDQWHGKSGGRAATTRRLSHGGGTVEEKDEGDVSGDEQNSRAAGSYTGEREVVARRKSASASSSFFTSTSAPTNLKRSGAFSDSACCYVSIGNNSSSGKHNQSNNNNKEASCNNNLDDKTNTTQREDGDVVVSCSRDIKLEPSHHLTDASDQVIRSCHRPSCTQEAPTSNEASHSRSGVLVRSTAAGVCCGAGDCSSVVARSGVGGALGQSPKKRWSPTGRRGSLEAVSEAAFAVTEAEAILQRWEDKESASRVAALLRSLVPLSVPTSSRHHLSPGGDEKKANPSLPSEHDDCESRIEVGSPLSATGCTAASEEGVALRTSGEKGVPPSSEDSAPVSINFGHCPFDRCNHYQKSNIGDQSSHVSCLDDQPPNESCKPREKTSQDRPSASPQTPKDASRTTRESFAVSNKTPHTLQGEINAMKPPQDQLSPDRPVEPDQRRGEGVCSSPPARGTAAYATNAAVKRQHQDATEEVSSQAQEAKVRYLESELARVIAELSCYKKIKTEPVESSSMATTAISTGVCDETDRHHRKERQRRHHFSSKEERRMERMRQRELATAAERNSNQHLQQPAGERESRTCYAQTRVDAGGGGEDGAGERRGSSSHRSDDGVEADPIRSWVKEQDSKRSRRREQSGNKEDSERGKGARQIEEGDREAAKKSACSAFVSSSSSSSGESPRPEVGSEVASAAGSSHQERQQESQQERPQGEAKGGDALKKHRGVKDAFRRETPKP